MSNPGQDEPPPWAGSQPEIAEDRMQARAALALLQSQFQKVSNLSYGGPAEASARRLAAVFDVTSSRAIAELAGRLLDLLFERPEEYLLEDDAKRVYLVMFIESKSLRELWKFIEKILTSASPGDQEILGKNVVTDFLKGWTNNVMGAVSIAALDSKSTSQNAAMSRWTMDLNTASYDFNKALTAGDAAEIANQAAEEASRARDLARQAAGDTGAATLGGHFKEIADEESKTAFWWTATAIGSLVLVIGAGIFIIYRSVYTHWIETLLHLAIVLPIIGLATFSAKLARHHRLLGRWAKTAAVQINSVAAFAEQVPTHQGREELILYLGRTVFGPPVFADDSKTEQVSAIPPELIDLLKEIIRRERP